MRERIPCATRGSRPRFARFTTALPLVVLLSVVLRAARFGLDLEDEALDLHHADGIAGRDRVARFARARHRAPSIITMPSGATGTSAVPIRPTIPSRPTVGVEKRARTAAVSPHTKNSTAKPITRMSTHHGTSRSTRRGGCSSS